MIFYCCLFDNKDFECQGYLFRRKIHTRSSRETLSLPLLITQMRPSPLNELSNIPLYSHLLYRTKRLNLSKPFLKFLILL
jgi:hypothetical protein